MTLLSPLWLSGLLLVPVLRWLHRGGRHRRAVAVSRLSLWQGAAATLAAAGERRPPDPAWRRRALLLALILLALAGPRLAQQRTLVTLWVDDSLSMLARDAQGTRIAAGLAQARNRLAGIPGAEVEVRALGDPWQSLGSPGDSIAAALAGSAGRREPGPPPVALLRRDRQHWLVTDGADATLFDWPGGRHPDHVIEVAGITRNVGLERLAARRDPVAADRLDLLLKVVNGGTGPETRTLSFSTGAGEMARSVQHLDAGMSTLVAVSIPASERVRARLQPGDALAEDDSIDLELGALRRRRVAIDSDCPRALIAAVATHPALAAARWDAPGVDAVLDCGTLSPARGLATVRVLAEHAAIPARGAVQWSSKVAASRRIRLEAENLRLAARLELRPEDVELLAVGAEPAIVGRTGPFNLIETALDFEAIAAAGGPEVPLLSNLMFEQALGSRLLDPVAITDRGQGASRVAPPARLAGAPAGPPTAGLQVQRDGTPAMLAAALLVLLWEIVALSRQWIRLGDRAGAAAP